ncbi:hypothetical protein DIRU0_D11606 [Diutina rugosa]
MAVPNFDNELCRDFGEYLAFGYYIWVQRHLPAGTRLDAEFEAQAFRFLQRPVSPLQRPVSPPQQPVADEGYASHGKCFICGRVVKNNLAYHMKCHHDYNNWDFNCKFRCLGECNRVKYKRKYLSNCILHMVTCHFKFDNDDIPKSRKIDEVLEHKGKCRCGYHEVAKKWLRDHVLTDECPLIRPQPVRPSPPPHQCTICGRRFENRGSCIRHEKTHRGTWDFNCKFRQLGVCGSYRGPSGQSRYCIKHMLHIHFKFDGIKRPWKLKRSILLQKYGECACGYHGLAKTWVDEHVLGDQCPLIDAQFESDHEE